MPDTTPLPWKSWDKTLNNMGEWLLIGAIAAASLPGVPSLLALLFLLLFWLEREEAVPDPLIKRFHELRRKYKTGSLTAEEAVELSRYEASQVLNPQKREISRYWIGFAAWFLAAAYAFWKIADKNFF